MTTAIYRRDILGGGLALTVARAMTLTGSALGGLPRSATAGDATTLPSKTNEDPTAGRTLAFDENFQSLDPSLWNAGPKATTFDTGFYGRSAFARLSGEEGFKPYAIVADPSATGGHALQISAKYIGKPMSVPNYYGNLLPEYQWISGNIQTAKPDGTITKGWARGYFEARMRFPKHSLTWPAFWLMNGRSILFPSTSIELDIVEQKGWEQNLYGGYLHEWGQPGEHHEGVGVPTEVDLTLAYHNFGMLVDGDRCVPYFDRKPVIDPKSGQPIQ